VLLGLEVVLSNEAVKKGVTASCCAKIDGAYYIERIFTISISFKSICDEWAIAFLKGT
jgi:hypothetical protein